MKEEDLHIHWTVVGYEKEIKDHALTNSVEISVTANNEKEAIEYAKLLIKRPNYVVRRISVPCPFESHNQDMALEIQKRMYKLLKKSV